MKDVSQDSRMNYEHSSSEFQNLIFDPNTNIKLDSEVDNDLNIDYMPKFLAKFNAKNKILNDINPNVNFVYKKKKNPLDEPLSKL